jgi:hypothetical protein
VRRLGAFVGALVVLAVISMAAGTAGAADTFAVSGEIDDLYPGYEGVLDARVTNTLDVRIHVDEVSGVVTGSDGCDPSALTITTAKTSLDLAPGETGTVPLEVTMRSDAGDACQGASFSVQFHGSSAAQDRPARALAFTGADATALVGVALVLLVAGVVLVRRAREQDTP